MVQDFAAILVVFSLLAAALFVLRKKGALSFSLPGGAVKSGPELSSRGRLQLTPQHSLHWVRAGEKEYLLALHPGACTVLSEESKK